MKDTATPRVDPRILRTRQLIKDAFIDLLQEMEINKITVNRIAERATINRVTFYLHYHDIQDLMEKMAQEMAEDIECIMLSTTTNMKSAEEIDSLKLVNLLEHIAENAKFYKVVLSSTRTPIFTERLLKILTKSITERMEIDSLLATTDIQRDIAIWHGSSALIGTIVAWLRKDMPYTPQFLAKQMYMLFHLSKDDRKST
ncbi:TetR family transcriptional regulator C-terminal domain-containing protein [Bacillus sp. ISL-40]|uniref:TetR/AcrR family transcriptional regulator n=1 Tax=unclassified Bacillus (in: firmicutes) TaxID=185979 RepID=UPI001BEA0262|nr:MULTISPECIES: TetR-like C-terminal domain-containing protein [unclassified Bacillus (in: firmicutes)]MBT2698943.1 TetR family transcriptional regulator C-terminal domain-containing protein [Bacillus sp. ISL-40]MBT2742657.1 TetR family transcriptional regulator C-terminal domain-containing protein [Bacillus sp. ISL-77]